MIDRRSTYLFIKEENRDSHKLHVFLEVQRIPEARKPEAMLWLLRRRRRDLKVEGQTPGRRFDELERQRETFSRRWLNLRGIDEFCGDAHWVHQRWKLYIYIYRVYREATNHEHLWSSDLRCGHEEFPGEKIDYEQTHGAIL